MKSLVILAALAAACGAMSAQAQEWGGIPLVNTAYGAGFIPTDGGDLVSPYGFNCFNTNTSQNVPGICTPAQLASGPFQFKGSGITETVTSLPIGAVAPGSNVGVLLQGGYPDGTSPP